MQQHQLLKERVRDIQRVKGLVFTCISGSYMILVSLPWLLLPKTGESVSEST